MLTSLSSVLLVVAVPEQPLLCSSRGGCSQTTSDDREMHPQSTTLSPATTHATSSCSPSSLVSHLSLRDSEVDEYECLLRCYQLPMQAPACSPQSATCHVITPQAATAPSGSESAQAFSLSCTAHEVVATCCSLPTCAPVCLFTVEADCGACKRQIARFRTWSLLTARATPPTTLLPLSLPTSLLFRLPNLPSF